VGLGAFAFLILGISLIWKMGERKVLSSEALVGIVFVTSLALGFLIVPQPELLESLIGDLSKISTWGAVLTVLLSAAVAWTVRRLYAGMMLMNISEDLALVEGIRERRTNFLYLFAIAVMVALGVKVTGSLLVGALVIVPPATARVLGKSLRSYAGISVAAGVLSCVAGVLVSHAVRFPPGPAIILVNALFFALAWTAKGAAFRRP
jgi:ABC-type Mn2+/Zn2+ transport system permease subunit